jgi:type IV pilus assembly protein PilA
MNARRSESGFTLIELLVVVIVIGVLAAIAIPTYLSTRQSAYLAGLTQDLRTAVIALESAGIANNGSYLSMDGATHGTPVLLASGYQGKSTTTIQVAATAASYCIEAEDSRVPGRLMIARSGIAGFEQNSAGC